MKKRFWLLIGLLLIGALLRTWQVGFNSLWFDEVFSRNVAVDSDAVTIARDGVAGDVHPPLYFILLSEWVRVVGDSDVALRFLTVLIMILVLPGLYHLGHLAGDERVGLIMLALGALSPFQIYYAQEARQYALSVLMAVWAMVGLFAALRGNKVGWSLYAAGMLGGLYTHYFMGLLFVAINASLLLYGPVRRMWIAHWRYWLAANLLITLLFLPQLSLFLHQTQAVFTSFWIDKPNPAAPIATLTFLLFSTTLPGLVAPVAIIVTICLLAIAALDMRRKAPRRAFHFWLLGLFAVLAPLAVILVVSLIRTPLYLDKSFGLLSPLLLLTIALGVAYGSSPSPARLLFGALLIIMAVGDANHGLVIDPAKPPYRLVARDLLAAGPEPILHLHDSSYLPVQYYARGLESSMKLVNLQERSWLYPRTWEIFGINRLARDELTRYLAGYKGKLRVVFAKNAEPSEYATLRHLLDTACAKTVKDYPPQVTVFEFDLGTC